MKAAAVSLTSDPRARVARKRLRDLRRWVRSSPVAVLTVLGALAVVAVLSLTFGDNAGVAHMDHVDAADYWTSGVTDKAQLPGDVYPAADQVERFVSAAVRYIVRASRIAAQSNATYGRFNYRYTLRMRLLHQSGSYNLLRHAGTAYALADACPPTLDESELPPCCAGSRETLVRAANWLASTAAPMGSGAIGLWSNRSLEAPRKRSAIKKANVVKAGGLGLGLIALLGGRRAGAPVSAALLRGVARGITHIFQRSDGRIDAFFSARTMEVEPERASDYYPGEAALGLIHLYVDTGVLAYRTAALRVILNRARTDGDEGERAHPICDHWMLIAIGHLLRDGATHRWSTRTAGGRRQRTRILRHARRVARHCHARNERQDATDRVLANRYGSSVEALLNVLPPLTEAGCADGLCPAEARALYCGARRALGAAMAMQYRADNAKYAQLLDGAVANVGVVERRGTRRLRIGFDGIFQIDTTQHTLSAALAYGRASHHPALVDVQCSHPRPLIDVVGTISDVVQARSN